jgi:hypothetical protein
MLEQFFSPQKNAKITKFKLLRILCFFVASEFCCIRKKIPPAHRISIAKPRRFPSQSPA